MNIGFYLPTKVLMGKECIKNNASVFSSLGKRALIVTGRHSAKQNGSQEDVVRVLESVGAGYAIYDQVDSNPTIECVRQGAAFAKQVEADFIIAIGGGSPMDAAKAIALLARQDIADEELFSANYTSDVLPMIFIPTTAGTGSEVTQYSILTNDKLQTKTSIATPVIFPTVAMLDAKYTKNLSLRTTVNTAIDALSHAVEGMLSIKANPMTDLLAKESIQNISECFESLIAGETNLEVREKLLYASMLGGIVIAHTGTTAVHSMGYSLTYFKHIDHGRANGLLIGEFLKFVSAQQPELIGKVLGAMNMKKIDEFEAILSKLLGEKEDITPEEFKSYAAIAIKAKNIANCVAVPTEEDLYQAYISSFN